jgi:hypothetical protein
MAKNVVFLLRRTLVFTMTAVVATSVVEAAEQRSRTARSLYDGSGVVPNRFELPTSSSTPKSHHANAGFDVPMYDRIAAAPRCQSPVHRRQPCGFSAARQGCPRISACLHPPSHLAILRTTCGGKSDFPARQLQVDFGAPQCRIVDQGALAVVFGDVPGEL